MSEEITFGKWLRQCRRKLDLTQQELADQAGCARITLSRIEAGTLKPSKELALILLAKIGIPKEEQLKWLHFARGLSGLPSEFPDRATTRPLTNLPILLTSFIGREKERKEVVNLISKHRLVALTGSGGVGKTRLALQIGGELSNDFPNGVWFVDLSSLNDPGLVPQTVLTTLGLVEQPGKNIRQILQDFLGEKSLLIILDNCEHLVEACAKLAMELLSHCALLKILATSREALGVEGEITWRVPSLSSPDPATPLEPDQLRQFESVRLFIDRAALAKTNFNVNNENAHALVKICQTLDGIPLAIELAAAKISILSMEQISNRLDDRFRLLTGGGHAVLERHQTLRATMDWSYNLLSAEEQALFRRLSVFVGGCSLDAAESVCIDEDTTTKNALRTVDILDILGQLVNKSLVIANERGGEFRYRLLETIRQYAHEELLQSGEASRMQKRYLDFFVKMSEEAEHKLMGMDQMTWLDRLESEMDNLRAALEWSLEGEQVVDGLRLAGSLWRFWDVRNHRNEGRERLAAFLSHRGATKQTRERAKALYAAGILAQIQNEYATADMYFSEGLEISRKLGDKRAVGYLLLGMAQMWARYRGYKNTRQFLDESLAIFNELGDRWGMALSLEGLGAAAWEQDDLVTASSRCTECIKIYRELGDKISLSFALIGLANVMETQGDYDQAVTLSEESLALFREMGYRWGISYALNILGEVARCQNDYSRAKVLYEESLAVGREIGDKDRIASEYHNLAYVSHHLGDYPQAAALFRQSLILSQEVGDTLLTVVCISGMAVEAQAMGHLKRAARLFGAAQALIEAITNRRVPADQIEYQRNLTALRAQLDEAAFQSAWAAGKAMTMEQAIEFAMSDID